MCHYVTHTKIQHHYNNKQDLKLSLLRKVISDPWDLKLSAK